MNNILFLINYKNYAGTCVSFCYQFLNQEKPALLVSLFDDYATKDIYYHYFIGHTNNLKFVLNETNVIKNILSSYPNYSWYVLLSPSVLYDKEFILEAENIIKNAKDKEFNCYPYNEKNNIENLSVIISKDKLTEYLRENLDIAKIQTRIRTNQEIKKTPLLKAVSVNLAIEYKDQPTLYEDNLCIFAKFLGSSDLIDSMVYINKINNRVYNIANNFAGNYMVLSDGMVRIAWNKSVQENIKYWLNPITKEYMPI